MKKKGRPLKIQPNLPLESLIVKQAMRAYNLSFKELSELVDCDYHHMYRVVNNGQGSREIWGKLFRVFGIKITYSMPFKLHKECVENIPSDNCEFDFVATDEDVTD